MGHMKLGSSMDGDTQIIEVAGQIDEDANFSSAELKSDKIHLDLSGIDAINSCGIREWIKWIKTAPESSQITYSKCPKVIVDQINMVAGFLPNNAQVESFYVPYYCDESGAEKMVLFESGKDYNHGELNPPEDVKCDESGEEMEMDVIEAKYFKFLKGA
ncbi:MAG: hypothetical protein MK008_06225 [Bdellovibrionales bacterium]|nr:hypothetical protein [Bdellovibrionales bacterium]